MSAALGSSQCAAYLGYLGTSVQLYKAPCASCGNEDTLPQLCLSFKGEILETCTDCSIESIHCSCCLRVKTGPFDGVECK